MKYVKQFTIIVSICFIGEILHKIIPLPVPASIYGLLLMFFALSLKIFPLEKVETASDFILEIMALFFVPSTVGLVTAGSILKKFGLQFIAIGLVSTVLVFGISGITTQLIIRILNRQKKRKTLDAQHEKGDSEQTYE